MSSTPSALSQNGSMNLDNTFAVIPITISASIKGFLMPMLMMHRGIERLWPGFPRYHCGLITGQLEQCMRAGIHQRSVTYLHCSTTITAREAALFTNRQGFKALGLGKPVKRFSMA